METLNPSEIGLDSFEQKREKSRAVLSQCQRERMLTSCYDCDKVFECQTRSDYVNCVYQSMSKGATGGFEF
ncbi:MAG: hypothetical protein LBQ52_01335 [Helicobacteraceae bacterium]|jgi:glycerol-3-phosphate cytidylyltransferase-like family protein|nr:hypothetical protein [Helicobacteraceae bacterium]